MDIRTTVEKAFERWKGSSPEIITRLPQSGSDRVYFRLICREDQVIGAYNPSREENEAFVGFSNHFRSKGLPVPEIMYIIPRIRSIFLKTWVIPTFLPGSPAVPMRNVSTGRRKTSFLRSQVTWYAYRLKGSEGLTCRCVIHTAASTGRA